MKCNESRPGFELVSPCPFPTTITITPRAPPRFILSDKFNFHIIDNLSIAVRAFASMIRYKLFEFNKNIFKQDYLFHGLNPDNYHSFGSMWTWEDRQWRRTPYSPDIHNKSLVLGWSIASYPERPLQGTQCILISTNGAVLISRWESKLLITFIEPSSSTISPRELPTSFF